MKKLRAAHIANHFIHKGILSGNHISPMKVIKLTYISHGWYLAITNEELYQDDVQAWKYGPVIRPLYHQVKHYGNDGITELIQFSVWSKDDKEPVSKVALIEDEYINKNPDKANQIVKFLDHIWDEYGDYTAVELSDMTHQKNTPWDISWYELGASEQPDFIIPSDLIQSYYSNLLADEREPQ